MNEKITCPHCHEMVFPREKLDADAWPQKKMITVCPLCGKVLPKAAPADSSAPAEKRSNALSELLGLGENDLEKADVFAGDEEGKFCRTCKHFIPHPFVNRCGLTDEEADPMSDCPQYEKRKPETEKKK